MNCFYCYNVMMLRQQGCYTQAIILRAKQCGLNEIKQSEKTIYKCNHQILCFKIIFEMLHFIFFISNIAFKFLYNKI